MALNLGEYNTGIIKASQNISDVVLKTPLLRSNWLSRATGCNVYCKMESEQITRSFKLRGATNKVKLLVSEKGSSGHNVVTASSGNHGMACAYLSSLFDINLTVFTYMNVAKNKEVEITQYPKVNLVKFGSECQEAEEKAKQHAAAKGLLYVSPYNDHDVICGQGTIGLEILDQLPDVDAVFVPVGGGGLIGGIAAFLKSVKPSIKVVGVQPVNDSSMYDSVKHGSILTDNEILDTFSSGTAGRVEVGSETFDLCKDYVDDWVLLEEEEIEKAVYDMLDKGKKLIEGAAGLGVAAIQKVQDEYKNKNVVLVICGGNIGAGDIKYVTNKFLK